MIGENIYTDIILIVSIAIFMVMIANIIYAYILNGKVYMAVAGSYKEDTQKLCSWEDLIGKCRFEDSKHQLIDRKLSGFYDQWPVNVALWY